VASSPHCVVMCSAPCAGVVRACGGANPSHTLFAWHAGRALAYALAGTVAATLVGWAAGMAAGSAFVRPLWSLLQAAALVLGVVMLMSGRMPAWTGRRGVSIRQGLAPVALPRNGARAAGPRRSLLAGLSWVAMPCGALYGALAISALANGPLEGGAVMLAFSAGSAAGLASAPLLWSRLARLPQHAAVRLAGALLASGSVWALWQGMQGASGAWCLPA